MGREENSYEQNSNKSIFVLAGTTCFGCKLAGYPQKANIKPSVLTDNSQQQ